MGVAGILQVKNTLWKSAGTEAAEVEYAAGRKFLAGEAVGAFKPHIQAGEHFMAEVIVAGLDRVWGIQAKLKIAFRQQAIVLFGPGGQSADEGVRPRVQGDQS